MDLNLYITHPAGPLPLPPQLSILHPTNIVPYPLPLPVTRRDRARENLLDDSRYDSAPSTPSSGCSILSSDDKDSEPDDFNFTTVDPSIYPPDHEIRAGITTLLPGPWQEIDICQYLNWYNFLASCGRALFAAQAASSSTGLSTALQPPLQPTYVLCTNLAHFFPHIPMLDDDCTDFRCPHRSYFDQATQNWIAVRPLEPMERRNAWLAREDALDAFAGTLYGPDQYYYGPAGPGSGVDRVGVYYSAVATAAAQVRREMETERRGPINAMVEIEEGWEMWAVEWRELMLGTRSIRLGTTGWGGIVIVHGVDLKTQRRIAERANDLLIRDGWDMCDERWEVERWIKIKAAQGKERRMWAARQKKMRSKRNAIIQSLKAKTRKRKEAADRRRAAMIPVPAAADESVDLENGALTVPYGTSNSETLLSFDAALADTEPAVSGPETGLYSAPGNSVPKSRHQRFRHKLLTWVADVRRASGFPEGKKLQKSPVPSNAAGLWNRNGKRKGRQVGQTSEVADAETGVLASDRTRQSSSKTLTTMLSRLGIDLKIGVAADGEELMRLLGEERLKRTKGKKRKERARAWWSSNSTENETDYLFYNVLSVLTGMWERRTVEDKEFAARTRARMERQREEKEWDRELLEMQNMAREMEEQEQELELELEQQEQQEQQQEEKEVEEEEVKIRMSELASNGLTNGLTSAGPSVFQLRGEAGEGPEKDRERKRRNRMAFVMEGQDRK